MKLLIYIITYPIIWILSILPFRVLYFLSDILYLIAYHVIGYRKKVVINNISLAFPEKSNKEIMEIGRASYKHFVDILIETIKFFSITEKQINAHYKYTNADMLVDLYKNGKSTILTGSHYANWEWILNINRHVPYKCIGAFTRVSNPYFNKTILKSRSKFGAVLVPTNRTIQEMENNHKNKVQAIYGLLSDQSPMIKRTYYWREFFGVKVPIHTGAEMLAKKYDMNLVLIKTKKIKRGYYETEFELLTDNPSAFKDYDLTDIFLEKVEEQIRTDPRYYFWTHNRFKHRDKAPKENIVKKIG